MGVFTSALDGAIEGARDRVIRDALNRKQNEIDELQEYNNLLSFGAKLYRAIAEGQKRSSSSMNSSGSSMPISSLRYC